MKKIYWLWMILLICCYGCKKEEEFVYSNPSIRLLGAEVVGVNQGELKLRIDLGAGFTGHKAWIQLMDISDASGKTTTQSVALTQEEEQELTVSVRPPVAGNDYQVMAVLETEKNRFETDKQINTINHWGVVTYPNSDSFVYAEYEAPFMYCLDSYGYLQVYNMDGYMEYPYVSLMSNP